MPVLPTKYKADAPDGTKFIAVGAVLFRNKGEPERRYESFEISDQLYNWLEDNSTDYALYAHYNKACRDKGPNSIGIIPSLMVWFYLGIHDPDDAFAYKLRWHNVSHNRVNWNCT